MDKILSKDNLEKYLVKIDNKYNVDEIFAYYTAKLTSRNPLPNTPFKFVKELEKRSKMFDTTVSDYIKIDLDPPSFHNRKIYGQYNNEYPLVKWFDIVKTDQIINLNLKCFIVANYKPFDECALNMYREKIKSYNCHCKRKTCMSLLKQIKHPKLVDPNDFPEKDFDYVNRFNAAYVGQYFDSITPGERLSLSRMAADKDFLRMKISVYKSIYNIVD